MLYRIKQFIWAILANFKKRDITYINKYLNEDEKKYFFLLINSEQEHCIRVSKDMLKNAKADREYSDLELFEIAKLGLLHDLGKSECKLGVCGKSIVVILDKLSNSKLRKYKNIKKIDIYYNHAAKGNLILQQIKGDYSKEFYEAVKGHHKKNEFINKSSNKKLKLLAMCDNQN